MTDRREEPEQLDLRRHSQAGAKASGPEALARAVRHRRRRAVHARRSRPDVGNPRKPGSAEEEREPERVHRSIVPATRRATRVRRPVFQIPYLCTCLALALEEGFDGWDIFKRPAVDDEEEA